MPHLIFVYGTLKRGGSNHRQLAGQRFVSSASTRPGYKLYLLAGYPGLVAVDRDGRSIEGEIWEVDPACLARVDKLEGTDKGLYARVPIYILPPNDSLAVEGYLYLLDVTGLTELGDNWPVS
jgi:gamma-glutamylaminecyclotransferase